MLQRYSLRGFVSAVRRALPSISITIPRPKLTRRRVAFAAAALTGAALLYPQLNCKVETHYQPHPDNLDILQNCPTVRQDHFKPSFFIPWCLAQTLYSLYSAKGIRLNYRSDLITLPNGSIYTIDWPQLPTTVSPIVSPETARAIVVILPGITSTSKEPYLTNLSNELLHSGYLPIIINNRWNGSTLGLAAGKHFNLEHDLKLFIQSISTLNPSIPLYAIGASNGANTLLNYLGTHPEETHIKAAVAISSPFNLEVWITELLQNRVIHPAMTQFNKDLVVKHEHEIRNSPPVFGLNYDEILAAPTMHDFMEKMTIRMFGFSTAEEYYRSSSSIRRLSEINIPTLMVSSKDDLIVPEGCLPTKEMITANKNLIFKVTNYGGHVNFFTGLKPKFWFSGLAIEYLDYFTSKKGNKNSNEIEIEKESTPAVETKGDVPKSPLRK